MSSSLDAVYLNLTDFEGPLPLLLHLIEKNELEVTRVSIAAVADQFIALVAATGTADLSTTGEFVAVAARLLLIKSRAILFRGNIDIGGDAHDDAHVLARQIVEYSRYQAAARVLGLMLEGTAATRPRVAVGQLQGTRSQIPRLRIDAISQAGRRLLAHDNVAEADTSSWPEVIYGTIKDDMLGQVRRLRATTFAALCERDWHPLVVITMFLAVLDAVRMDELVMRQAVAFGPIELSTPGTGARRA